MKTHLCSFFFLLIFPALCLGANLTYVKTQARLPSVLYHAAGIFDGDDAIFIFGGIGNPTYQANILKYTLSTDSIEVVGKLTQPGYFTAGNAITMNAAGIIHAFPVFPKQHITAFNPLTKETELVGDVSGLENRAWRPFAQIGENKVALVGGALSPFHDDIVTIDLETFETLEYKTDVFQGSLIFDACAYDAVNETLYTLARNGSIYSILRYKFGAEEFENVLEIPRFGQLSGAVWADGKMFVVDDTAQFGGEDEGVAVFDPVSISYDRLPVQGLNRTLENVYNRAVVYLEKLQRIYLIGGYQSGVGGHDGIWYVDLGIPLPPTDAPTTSTPSPPLFSCFTKPDGFYPHPESCKEFLSCLDGVMTEYECPDALLFDPIDLTCKHANNVICELSCVGRPDGVYPHPEDCASFLTCHDDLGQVNKCPEPLLFDPDRFMCNFPHLVNCGNATTSSFW